MQGLATMVVSVQYVGKEHERKAMSTRFTEIQKSLRGRWRPEWSKNSTFSRAEGALNGALHAVNGLCAKNDALKSSGRYSPQGLRDEIRMFAQKETVPELRRAAHAVEVSQTEIRNKRASLVLPKSDPNDISGAILRGEMRNWLRTLPQAEAVRFLTDDNVDDRLLTAALEVPPAIVGLTDQVRGHIEAHLLNQRHSAELDRLQEFEEVIGVANAAIGVSLYQLRRETDFGENETAQFDAWMQAASIEIDRQLANATSKIHAASPAPGGDFNRDIRDIVDEVFAKALPELYPDHPVNRAS